MQKNPYTWNRWYGIEETKFSNCCSPAFLATVHPNSFCNPKRMYCLPYYPKCFWFDKLDWNRSLYSYIQYLEKDPATTPDINDMVAAYRTFPEIVITEQKANLFEGYRKNPLKIPHRQHIEEKPFHRASSLVQAAVVWPWKKNYYYHDMFLIF